MLCLYYVCIYVMYMYVMHVYVCIYVCQIDLCCSVGCCLLVIFHTHWLVETFVCTHILHWSTTELKHYDNGYVLSLQHSYICLGTYISSPSVGIALSTCLIRRPHTFIRYFFSIRSVNFILSKTNMRWVFLKFLGFLTFAMLNRCLLRAD